MEAKSRRRGDTVINCLKFTGLVATLLSTFVAWNALSHAENVSIHYDWINTLGEWSQESGNGVVQLGAVRQSLEEPRQSLTLHWLALNRDSRRFQRITPAINVEICGADLFQNVDVVSVADGSQRYIDLALKVRFLPTAPGAPIGKTRLIFLVVDNDEKSVAALNCRPE